MFVNNNSAKWEENYNKKKKKRLKRFLGAITFDQTIHCGQKHS